MENFYISSKLIFLLAVLNLVCSERNHFCAEEVAVFKEFGKTVTITSPEYPKNYNISKDCKISLIVVGIKSHGVHLVQNATDCAVPYKVVNASTAVAPQQFPHCGTASHGFLYTNDIVTYVPVDQTAVHDVLLQAGEGPGFIFTVQIFPLQIMSSSNQPISLTSTPNGYIMSHQQFNVSPYLPNLDLTITLRDFPQGQGIAIDFIYIQLGDSDSCQPDHAFDDQLKIYSYPGPVLHYSCIGTSGTTLPTQQFIDTTSVDYLGLTFQSYSSITYNGFLLRYSTYIQKTTTTQESVTSKPISYSSISTTQLTTQTNATQTRSPQTSLTQTSSQTSTTQTSIDRHSYWSTNRNKETSSTPANFGPDTLREFFTNHPYAGIAIGVGGGGLLLVVIIIILGCVIRRQSVNRRHFARQNVSSKNSSAHEMEIQGTPLELSQAKASIEAKQRPYISDGYSDVDLGKRVREHTESEVEAKESFVDGDSTAGVKSHPEAKVTYAAVNKDNKANTTALSEHTVETEVVYAPINKKQVEMIENDLYAST